MSIKIDWIYFDISKLWIEWFIVNLNWNGQRAMRREKSIRIGHTHHRPLSIQPSRICRGPIQKICLFRSNGTNKLPNTLHSVWWMWVCLTSYNFDIEVLRSLHLVCVWVWSFICDGQLCCEWRFRIYIVIIYQPKSPWMINVPKTHRHSHQVDEAAE